MQRLPAGPTRPEIVQAVAYHRDPLGVPSRRASSREGAVRAGVHASLPAEGSAVIVAAPEALGELRLQIRIAPMPGRRGGRFSRRRLQPHPLEATRRRRRVGRGCGPGSPRSGYRPSNRRSPSWPASMLLGGLAGAPSGLLEVMRALCTDITGDENARPAQHQRLAPQPRLPIPVASSGSERGHSSRWPRSRCASFRWNGPRVRHRHGAGRAERHLGWVARSVVRVGARCG